MSIKKGLLEMKKNYLNYGIVMLIMGIVWFFDLLPHNENKKLDFGGTDGGLILGLIFITIGSLMLISYFKR